MFKADIVCRILDRKELFKADILNRILSRILSRKELFKADVLSRKALFKADILTWAVARDIAGR